MDWGLVKETGEGGGVTVECDLANPLVESGILDHGVEIFLHDHTIFTLYVVHMDEPIEVLGPTNEQWPEVGVSP